MLAHNAIYEITILRVLISVICIRNKLGGTGMITVACYERRFWW